MPIEPYKLQNELDFTLEVLDNQLQPQLRRSVYAVNYLGDDSIEESEINQTGIIQKVITLNPANERTQITFPDLFRPNEYLTMLIENPNWGEIYYTIEDIGTQTSVILREGFILERGFHFFGLQRTEDYTAYLSIYFMRVNPAPTVPMTAIVTIFGPPHCTEG
jgi:hypothetical protein